MLLLVTLAGVLNGYTSTVRLGNIQQGILLSVDLNTAHYDEEDPLNVNIRIYNAFQQCVIVYIGCEVMYYWGFLSLLETQWVNTILSNSIIFSLTVDIGYEFRMRSFGPNFHLVDGVSMAINNNGNPNDNSDVDEGTNNNNFITQEWVSGIEIPLFPKDYNRWLSANNRT